MFVVIRSARYGYPCDRIGEEVDDGHDLFHRPVTPLRRDVRFPGQGGTCCSLGIDRIRLPQPATHLTIRSVHLHHHDPFTMEMSRQADAIRPGALNPNPDDRTEPCEPVRQQPIANCIRRERLDPHHATGTADRDQPNCFYQFNRTLSARPGRATPP